METASSDRLATLKLAFRNWPLNTIQSSPPLPQPGQPVFLPGTKNLFGSYFNDTGITIKVCANLCRELRLRMAEQKACRLYRILNRKQASETRGSNVSFQRHVILNPACSSTIQTNREEHPHPPLNDQRISIVLIQPCKEHSVTPTMQCLHRGMSNLS